MSYKCPTCGGSDLPEVFRKAIGEFEALEGREGEMATELLKAHYFHGNPSGRGWSGAFWSCMNLLVPSFGNALEVGRVTELMGLFDEGEES